MPSTRLAAIHFTDIVGYTAMMQQNREQAMHAVRFYESHHKENISPQHFHISLIFPILTIHSVSNVRQPER